MIIRFLLKASLNYNEDQDKEELTSKLLMTTLFIFFTLALKLNFFVYILK